MDPRVLARRSGDARLSRAMRAATLFGYARVRFARTAYPTLIRRTGATVAGAIIRPGGAAMAALSAYEGPCYRLRPVLVTTRRGPMLARAWIVPARMADDRAWPDLRRSR